MRNARGPRMSRTTRKAWCALAAAAVLLCVSVPAAAQQSTLDNISSMTASAQGSGMYATGRAGATGIAAGAPVTVELVREEARVLAAGAPADQAVAAVLSGAPATAVASVLTGAGAPDAQVGPLMARLTALAYSPGVASLKAAMQAYNALVKAAPARFVTHPPPQLLTIRTALIAIWQAR